MSRLALHGTDDILDAARALVLEEGLRRTTIDAIARASRAPVGSLYHRFRSRDHLLATLWVRAVKRSQATFLAALTHNDPAEAGVRAALSLYDFALQHRDDARLLVSFRRADLVRVAKAPELARELKELNHPVERALIDLAKRLYGRPTPTTTQQIALAIIDLPYGAIRRHLVAGTALPFGLRGPLEAAVRAALEHKGKES